VRGISIFQILSPEKTLQNKQNENEPPFRGLRQVSLLTTIPMVMVGGLLVGYFFGNWIDRFFKCSPWGKVTLSILGIIAGFKQTIRLIQEATKENEKTD